MKTSESILQSAKSRLNQAANYADELIRHVERMKSKGIDGKGIAKLRMIGQSVDQCVHEFNAYWNAYETE